jgi:two-component system cell cycle sensor histidine kinase/response regulator CckA
VGEDTAVEALRGGADDFIVKHRLGRLGPSIERALREKASHEARRRAEEALRRTEEQLRQIQKMEAIGSLAGGVAHDFNNLMTIVIGYSASLIDDLPASDPLRAHLLEIKGAGERAADLTRQLLAFSRQQILEPTVLSLSDVTLGLEGLLRRLIGEHVQLSVRTSTPLGKVKVDKGQIEQAVLNLASNARDAMPGGGELRIEVADVELDEHETKDQDGACSGRHVVLAVSDTGSGIDEATRERMFEPFFTTKARGKGTGLGLASVFGIVRQSGGRLSVDSEIGKGTTFKIYFPCVDEDEPAPSVPPKSYFPTRDALRGSETILVVEDDQGVRAFVRTILARYGHRVLEARGGGEALSICEESAKEINLLLTDIVMPQMNGPEVARRLTLLCPSMKVVYMSGYADDSILEHDLSDARLALLRKPITPHALMTKVREVLDGPAAHWQHRQSNEASALVADARRCRVLVVDDEPLLVKLFTRSLRRDYDVIGSTDPRAALQRLEGGETFDLILCDLSMPTMSGMELFDELKRLAPHLASRVVFLTGGATTAAASTFLAENPNTRIEKPVSPSELVAFVRKTLN